MKTVYIPKGETVHYESLVTEHLVVHGHLHVTYGIKAKTITGKGVINAGTIDADTVCIDDVEAASVICKRLIAKRAQAPEIFASESAAVSCFLSAAYVETGKLTVAISEIDVVEAQEVVNLKPKKRSLFGTLLASVLRSFWTALTVRGEKAEVMDAEFTPVQEETAEATQEEPAAEQPATVQEVPVATAEPEMDVVDEELNRIIGLFKLSREQGYIEELGESGKNLLEMYLPMIPHETVLAELSEPVREALKDESLLSPDAWLKRRREEIRGLEERITYLGGQKDLAESQSQTYEQTHQEMASQIEKLRWEILGLEAKQFAGMDTSEMQERLVELSQRYDEAARDDRSDAAEQQRNLSALRAKIARRQAEQYQSKFTQALADISAKVKELGARYQRETAAYKAFHAGMECPTCHRPVTEQSLSEVQAALKKVISDLYAAGTEQRGQLTELQEMDKKAADTFEQFKADDLAKWQAEAAELEQACTELSGSASKEVERLRMEIQTLSAELDYGNLKATMQSIVHTCPPPSANHQDIFAAWRQVRARETQRRAAPPKKISFDRRKFAPYLEKLGSDKEIEELFLEFLRQRVN